MSIVAYPAWSGLGWLGDDTSTLLDLGFTSAQISQIHLAHQSGALSDGGYSAILNGYVTPDDLENFMANVDPGAPEVPTTSGTGIAVSNVQATLTPRPSPTVSSIPVGSPLQFLTQSTWIAGWPNWAVLLVGGVLLSAIAGGGASVELHGLQRIGGGRSKKP